jgi:hypothetical protein
VTGRITDRHLRIASAAAEDVLEERALLRSILQHIRTRVTLARDLAHEMERRRPAQAPGKPRRQAPPPARRDSK